MLTKKYIVAFGLAAALVLTGCSSSSTPKENDTTETEKTFTVSELAKFDGQGGNKAYVAVDGKVYDVTGIEAWKGGEHQGNKAGQDLTEAIKKAPHGVDPLEGATLVGTLSTK